MKLIFISGKYTGKTYTEVEENITKANYLGMQIIHKLNKDNFYPIIPHNNVAHFEELENILNTNKEYWLNGAIEILSRCDAIFMMKNYKDSKVGLPKGTSLAHAGDGWLHKRKL